MSRRLAALIVVLAASACRTAGVETQGASAAGLDAVLARTQVESFLVSASWQMADALEFTGLDVPPDLQREIDRAFADTTLYRYVLEGLEERSDPQTTQELTAWLFSDWVAEVDSLTDASSGSTPPRPDAERLALVRRFVAANQVGAFFAGVDAAYADAARHVGRAMGREGEPPTRAMSEEQIERTVEASFVARFALLSDEQLRRYVEAYESPSGQWYVQAYSASLAAAIRRAGRELAARL